MMIAPINEPPSNEEWEQMLRKAAPEEVPLIHQHALASHEQNPKRWNELLTIAAKVMRERGITD
jgi:hypothetical protein